MKNATCVPAIRAPANRQPALPRTILRDGDSADLYHPCSSPVEDSTLVVVQSRRVVCMVEGHRHEAAFSVARLLCRLLLGETRVYACEPEAREHLTADLPATTVPASWRELYRVSPWADGTACRR